MVWNSYLQLFSEADVSITFEVSNYHLISLSLLTLMVVALSAKQTNTDGNSGAFRRQILNFNGEN